MTGICGVTRSLAALTVIGLAGASAAACTADEPVPPVVWGECSEEVVAEAAPSRLDCATVPVPVNYADPTGGEIDIMISRLASPNPNKRRGVLLLNPGGPGGSGLAFPAFLVAQGLPASVTDSFDVIGMDTRGIGHTAPVSCGFTGKGPYVGNIPPYAVDDAAVTERATVVDGVAQQCARNDRARLVSVDASGHGAYVLGDNTCAQGTTTSYLVDGTMPEHDVSCGPS
jgi:hypothetical protein